MFDNFFASAKGRSGSLRCLTSSALIASLSFACAASKSAGNDSGAPLAHEAPSSNPEDAASATVENFIAFETGSPASVYWDDAAQVLYIGDNDANQVWRWTDAKGLEKFGTTTDPGGEVDAMATLVGQIVHLEDGTVVVARFGKPGAGFSGVAWLKSDGSAGLVPNLDENVKRLGLAQAKDGALYGTYFKKGDAGPTGTVTRVDLADGESIVAEGFGKLIGLVAIDDTLYVSDQSAGAILAAPLAKPPKNAADWQRFADLPVPDQVCAGPEGGLFSGQFQAAPGSTDPVAIRQISAEGKVTTFKSDPDVAKPSGVAYDPTGKRLFAADTGNAAHVGVHIFQVP